MPDLRKNEYPNYEIHKNGKIFRIKMEANGKVLKRRELYPTKAKNGYRTVKLRNKSGIIKQLYLHRLVYMAFNGEIPPGGATEAIMNWYVRWGEKMC